MNINLKCIKVATNFIQFLGPVLQNFFRISVTFEMRTIEYSEIYISIDTHTVAEQVYKGEETVWKESKVAERQRERECVCASVDRN